MRISSSLSSGAAVASPQRASQGSALERQIAHLQKQVQSLKQDKQSSAGSADQIKELEKQIGELQQQLTQQKLQENKKKLEEAQQRMAAQAEREAAERQDPDDAVISQQARNLFSAMNDIGELSTLRKVQSSLPTREERENFAATITAKAYEIQKGLVQNTKLQAELAQTRSRFNAEWDLHAPKPSVRELPDGELELLPAKTIFETANAMFDKTLGHQPEAVKKAAAGIIENNFSPAGAEDMSMEELDALREAGMAQAQYIADNYISDANDKKQFMGMMLQISAVTGGLQSSMAKIEAAVAEAKLRNMLGGAPNDHVDMQELMRRNDPAAYEKFQEALPDPKEALSILLSFTKTVPRHPDWIKSYHEDNRKLDQELVNLESGNRFKDADTSSLSAFVSDMMDRFGQFEESISSSLQKNMLAFARIFEQ